MQAVSFLRTGIDPRVKNPIAPAAKPMGSKILSYNGAHGIKAVATNGLSTSVKQPVITKKTIQINASQMAIIANLIKKK